MTALSGQFVEIARNGNPLPPPFLYIHTTNYYKRLYIFFLRLEYNVPGTFYVLLSTPEDLGEWAGTFSPTLKFVVKDCDPTTGEPDSDEG